MQTKAKLIDAIYRRRSIRKYEEASIDDDTIQILMEAALRAPSARNKRNTQFVLVKDKEMLLALSHLKSTGASFIQDSTISIVVLASPLDNDLSIQDASIAASYIQLQASELGFGSCWVNVYGSYTENGQESSEYVRRLLDIPYQLEVICVITIGKPLEDKAPYEIEDLRWEMIHIDKFHMTE